MGKKLTFLKLRLFNYFVKCAHGFCRIYMSNLLTCSAETMRNLQKTHQFYMHVCILRKLHFA